MCRVTRREAARWRLYFEWKQERVGRDQYLSASIVQAIEKLYNCHTTAPGAYIRNPRTLGELLVRFDQQDSDVPIPPQMSYADRVALMQSAWCAMTGYSAPG